MSAKPILLPELADYLPMVHKLARGCYQRLPRGHTTTLNDLVNDGVVVFLTVRSKWQSERAQFSTYLWTCLLRAYVNIMHKHYRSLRCIADSYNSELLRAHSRPVHTHPQLGEVFYLTLSRDGMMLARELADGNSLRASYHRLGWSVEYSRDKMNELRIAASRAMVSLA